jgi:hypothetical protein
MRLQMEMIQELPQEAAGRQRKAPSEMLKEDYCFSELGCGHPLAVGRAAAHDGITRPWHSSSILLSFTKDPSQDPLGKGAGASPLPFGRGTFGAILVWIWPNGMAAKEVWNPSLVWRRFRAQDIWGERAAKERGEVSNR